MSDQPPGVVRGCGHVHLSECAAEQEFPIYGFRCPTTERDGLTLGDEVLVGGRWPAEVVSFECSPCCVGIKWTGKRPVIPSGPTTICKHHVTVETVAEPPGWGRVAPLDEPSESDGFGRLVALIQEALTGVARTRVATRLGPRRVGEAQFFADYLLQRPAVLLLAATEVVDE